MTQTTATIQLQGGLNLASPILSVPPGQAISSINYEPLPGGYGSLEGYEAFDGQPRPSDSTDAVEIAARRAAILAVPGTGPVRGVQVYRGDVYAFREQVTGENLMFRASASGWEEMTFGSILDFELGTAEFVEGEFVAGGTSGATALIQRMALMSGAWSGTATGYLTLSDITGTFQDGEIITSSSGSATATTLSVIALPGGGRFQFTTHNFYGAAKLPRLYFCNGEGFAYEWNGVTLAPIRTGTSAGALEDVSYILAQNGDFIIAQNGDSIIAALEFDRPLDIAHYKNHLFLFYLSGSGVFSSTGEPLEYRTTTGAGEISFGEEPTGVLAAASGSMMIFGKNRVEYLTGDDATNFKMDTITDASGAVRGSVQMMDGPVYLDDGGIRNMNTTAAFGDWKNGTLSQLVDDLLTLKRESGVLVASSVKVKDKNHYRLLWDDGSGLAMYVGRKNPELMPFKLGITPFCACSGEVTDGEGDRIFVGAEDGFVYEMERGTSFNGDPIKSYIRLPFNNMQSSRQQKRFDKLSIDINSPDDIELGMTYHLDYANAQAGSGSRVEVDVAAGANMPTTALYDDITWGTSVQGQYEEHIDGFGSNIAVTLIHESAVAEPHTLAAITFNFTYRGLKR